MPDFFIAPTFADLNDEFRDNILKYIHLVKSRVACRCTDTAYHEPQEDYEDFDRILTDAPPTTETLMLTVTEAPATVIPEIEIAGIIDGVTGPEHVREINSCCGHNMYNSVPYDNALRTCCDDGKAVRWTADGGDPCNMFDVQMNI